jgi:hypothetical protein
MPINPPSRIDDELAQALDTVSEDFADQVVDPGFARKVEKLAQQLQQDLPDIDPTRLLLSRDKIFLPYAQNYIAVAGEEFDAARGRNDITTRITEEGQALRTLVTVIIERVATAEELENRRNQVEAGVLNEGLRIAPGEPHAQVQQILERLNAHPPE